MTSDRQTLIFPVLLIAVGTGWLLTTLGIVPGIDWAWTLGLAAIGLLALLVWGIDKVTVIVGPLFIVAGILSALRQTRRLNVDVEVPILVILVGVLFFIARLPAIPVPRWLIQPPKKGT